eukprot:1151974-Pleurochrysis_carterae.AAC.1
MALTFLVKQDICRCTTKYRQTSLGSRMLGRGCLIDIPLQRLGECLRPGRVARWKGATRQREWCEVLGDWLHRKEWKAMYSRMQIRESMISDPESNHPDAPDISPSDGKLGLFLCKCLNRREVRQAIGVSKERSAFGQEATGIERRSWKMRCCAERVECRNEAKAANGLSSVAGKAME